MLSRRKILGVLAASPVAAKAAAEQAGMVLAGIKAKPIGERVIMPPSMGGISQAGINQVGGVPLFQRIRKALQDRRHLEALVTKLYQDERNIYSIDHDLASKRSFSVAAKLAYQRQRNVERRLDEIQSEHQGYDSVSRFINKILGDD